MLNSPFQYPYGTTENAWAQPAVSPLAQNPLTAPQASLQPLLQNPFTVQQAVVQTYNLTQIDKFDMVKSFKDDTNVEWTLVKQSSDSTVDIPDPKTIQILGYWNHVFPGIKEKIYIYVVEGIRQPRVDTEKPTLVLYQWFSATFAPNFTPDKITQREWLKANVYAAPILDARISKLHALCKIPREQALEEPTDQLLHVEGLTNERVVLEQDTQAVEQYSG